VSLLPYIVALQLAGAVAALQSTVVVSSSKEQNKIVVIPNKELNGKKNLAMHLIVVSLIVCLVCKQYLFAR
jgi:exosome complex RNA-binding protein Rrp42 (RNase PH superfamily)